MKILACNDCGYTAMYDLIVCHCRLCGGTNLTKLKEGESEDFDSVYTDDVGE